MTDRQRAFTIVLNVPFLILLHVAFLVHVLSTVLVWLVVYPDARTIWQTIKANYTQLVIRLFKSETL